MLRNLLGLLVFFLVALGLVALTFSAATEAPADFTFVNGTEPKSLDPAIITGQPEGRIADAIFEGLTYRDPKSLLPVPGAAKAWDISEDRLTWTFHMRPEARWSDGKPVTAHDFAWSWRRLQLPDTAAEYAYILHMIRGAEILNTFKGNSEILIGPLPNENKPVVELLDAHITKGKALPAAGWREFLRKHALNEALKGVEDKVLEAALTRGEAPLEIPELQDLRDRMQREGERRAAAWAEADRTFGKTAGVFAKDDHTLVVQLKALTPYFLDITAFYPTYPAPRWVVESHKTDWFLPRHIVTNGPYRLEAWRVNEKIRLVKNDTYWNPDSIALETIDALPTENAATVLNLYLTGVADWISGTYPQDLVDMLRERPDFYDNEGLMVYYYRINTERKHFRDPRVRRAIAMSIDRQAIVDHILKLGQKPAHHFVPPGIDGYERPASGIRFDPAEAKRLLAEAGFEGGRGIPELGILYNTSESHQKVAENVAYQLRENLGLRVSAYNQEWQAYQQTVRDMEYDLARAGWIGDYRDPNTFLDMWVTNGGNNQTGFTSPVYDRLLRYASEVERFLEAPESLLAALKEPKKAQALVEAWREAAEGRARVEAAARVRMHLFREAEALVVQDGYPVVPIYFYVVSGLTRPWVKGFYSMLELPDGSRIPNYQDIHPLRGMSIDVPVREAAR